MVKREDGIIRKKKLLKAATKVFASKGFKNATVAEICKAAKSNVASVNYYFGSKENLYAEVWKNAFGKLSKIFPIDYNLEPDTSLEEKLRIHIKALLNRMFGLGTLGNESQILLIEITNPTDVITDLKRNAIKPLRDKLVKIIQGLLGKNATEQEVIFCSISIFHQCFGYSFKRGLLPKQLRSMNKTELIESLAEHVTLFSLAGIAEIKKRIYKKIENP